MAEWQWGSDKKAVAITEDDAKALAARIVEGVTKDRVSDLMEQYKQFVQASSDLAEARREIGRKDQEIFNLQSRIAHLNGFIASSANGAAPQAYQVPSYQDRYAATAPMPPLFHQMPEMTPAAPPLAPWSQASVPPAAGE